jgi:hypothetical protein
MKKIILIYVIFSSIVFNAKAENELFKPVNYFTQTLEKLIPSNLFKQVGKKITRFGGKEIFIGGLASTLLSSGLTDNNVKNEKIIKSNNLIKVQARGQINLDGQEINTAKRKALEDALYFASMKAGAEVSGFSTIDEETSLNENFIVKPNNKILDYRILKSFEENNNYIVDVEAIVGNLNNFDSICSKRKILNIKEFKGNYIINTNTPSWAYNYLEQILYKVRRLMFNDKSINYVDNSSKIFDFNYSNFDKSYDYKTLVNGTVQIENGDYIYIPSFSLEKSKIFPKFYKSFAEKEAQNVENNYLLDSDALGFKSKIEIFDGVTNSFVTSIEKEYLIPLNIDSNFEMIELFSKKDNKFINNKLDEISKDLFDTINAQLSCKPIIAKIEIVNNKLEVPLGHKQGLRVNQLAVLEDNTTTNVTMLSISELTNNRAILSPLNDNIKINSFLGKQTRFLE